MLAISELKLFQKRSVFQSNLKQDGVEHALNHEHVPLKVHNNYFL